MPSLCAWRIDDLAHRADVTVDTVRYYQREDLLPVGERAGRVKLYGPIHLERLERIRDLQAGASPWPRSAPCWTGTRASWRASSPTGAKPGPTPSTS